MQTLFLDLKHLPILPPLAMTIGNFDGVHLGHQAMVDAVLTLANNGQKSAVMIFEPQPKEFFDPANAPARLTNLAEKSARLEALGVDFLLVIRFDHAFRSLSAEEFCHVLHRLNVKQLVLGDDFRFGQGRAGDKAFLRQSGFEVTSLDSILMAGVRISSTHIRNKLSQGDITGANILLGYDYTMTGKVVHGDKIGRTLGFPTANIALERLRPAPLGVFGADVLIFDENGESLSHTFNQGVAGLGANSLFGAVNIGTRPSVAGKQWRFEVHLPNFSADLYGKHLQVRFLHYLHAEMTYPNLDALTLGINQDIQQLLGWRYQQTPLTH